MTTTQTNVLTVLKERITAKRLTTSQLIRLLEESETVKSHEGFLVTIAITDVLCAKIPELVDVIDWENDTASFTELYRAGLAKLPA